MEKCTINYTIQAEGNDLDAKALQKVPAGRPLTLSRLYDEEDTWEITVSYNGKTLGMLDYKDCVGIAPFIDDDSLKIDSATAAGVTVSRGRVRAADVTTLALQVEYSYDERRLTVCSGRGGCGFVPDYDVMAAMAVYRVLDGDDDIIMKQTHLNRYRCEIPVDGRRRSAYFDGDFAADTYVFRCRVLFDENFTKCKISACLYNKDRDERYETELDEREKQTALTLVNHSRIFAGDKPLSDDTEVE